MQSLLQWAQANPELAIGVAGWLLFSAISTACSVSLRILRAAYPEPANKLPRWVRGVEAGLDEIAMNSKRAESMDILKKIAEKKS